MSQDADSLIKEAIKKSKAGDKAGARALLEQATEVDPNSEKAWLWLSGVVDSPDDQRVCLENVLYLNPNNENAKRGLQILDQKYPKAAVPEPEPDPAPAAADDDLWDTNDTSASGTGDSTNPFTVSLDDFDDVFADAFDDDSDPFAADVFATEDASSLLDDNPFGASPDLGDDDLFEQDTFVADSDPFGVDDGLESDFDDSFGSDDSLYAEEAEDDSFESLSASGIFGDLDDDLQGDDFMDSGVGAVNEEDPSYYFRQIPEKIKATSLPGKRGLSVIPIVVLLVLIVANIGAVIMLNSG